VKNPIPKTVKFPFGYVVKVEQLSPDDLFEKVGTKTAHSLWFVDDLIIYLDKSRPIKLKRDDLIHEMDHAFNDWRAWCHAEGLAEPKG
jgi:hypothetical protein